MATEHLIEEYATETIYLLLSPLQKKNNISEFCVKN